jgi:4-hydroxybenzoate polyprenyltransferase
MALTSKPDPQDRRSGVAPAAARPLVIAVDAALVRSHPALDALVASLKRHPGRLLHLLAGLWRGRDALARRLAEQAPADADALPVNEALADLAQAQAAAGRPVFLASSRHALAAERLLQRFPFAAGHLDLAGLAGPALADTLARRFPGGFDYAGSAATDPHVWRQASGAVLVDATPQGEGRVAGLVPIVARLPAPSRLRGLVSSLRLHQWAKNVLVFAPIILGGKLDEPQALLATVVAFLALGLVASSTYLVNDILDAADDRRHWSKRERPIAKGVLPVPTAAACAAAGLAAGLAVAACVSWQTLGVLLAYVGLTLSYSLGIKRLPLVDGLVLAVQFTLRLALGVVAAQVPPSPWLFVFSMFLFTSLSLAKRYTELHRSHATRGRKIAVRGYRAEDAPLVLAVGVAAGLAAVVIMVLYIIDDAFRQSFYGNTLSLWGFPPVVFLLVCRIWLVTARGEMDDDPLRFMLADRTSQALLAVLATCFAFAWLA